MTRPSTNSPSTPRMIGQAGCGGEPFTHGPRRTPALVGHAGLAVVSSELQSVLSRIERKGPAKAKELRRQIDLLGQGREFG